MYNYSEYVANKFPRANVPIYTNPTWGVNKGQRFIPGPGHNPDNPQPVPNRTAPEISFLSILSGGNDKFPPKRGFFYTFNMYLNVIILHATAESNTNNKLGSQFSSRVKNPVILLLLSMPLIAKPEANIEPTPKLNAMSIKADLDF